MNRDQIRQSVIAAIRHVAPEADPAALPGDADIRDELDLDSMDFLNVVVKLHADLGIDIPETDYAELYTLDRAVGYLGGKLDRR